MNSAHFINDLILISALYSSENSGTCKSRPYANPLYGTNTTPEAEPYECPNQIDYCKPKQEDISHGVESEKRVHVCVDLITARPVSDVVKAGHFDQKVADNENLYDDIAVNNMPESEQHRFSNPRYVAPEDRHKLAPANGTTLLRDDKLPENDPENVYDDIGSPIADSESESTGEDLYEEIAEERC